MRGTDRRQDTLFSYLSPESRVPKSHPLRPVRVMTDRALAEMHAVFEAVYATSGRPSIPPEQLLRALLLQVFYTIRSERLLVEQLDYNLLFRWFVGLAADDPVWDASTFSKNRDRLLEADAAHAFFARILAQAKERKLLSDEHFSVDGTLIEAWASMKSVRPKDGGGGPTDGDRRNPEVNFRGQRRRNDTHASTTDPEAKLYRKGDGRPAQLCYLGHLLIEHRHGLVVDERLTEANGTAERDAAEAMVAARPGQRRLTVAGDKNYDTRDFVAQLRLLNATPHVAQNTSNRRSAIDGRTIRHPGYRVSQRFRKRIEEAFGWAKTVGGLRKVKHRGQPRVAFQTTLTFAAYNLVRMRNLASAPP